ncbi:MAG: hypothetical protein R3B09_09630 [Nannocystaceae bacterium]
MLIPFACLVLTLSTDLDAPSPPITAPRATTEVPNPPASVGLDPRGASTPEPLPRAKINRRIFGGVMIAGLSGGLLAGAITIHVMIDRGLRECFFPARADDWGACLGVGIGQLYFGGISGILLLGHVGTALGAGMLLGSASADRHYLWGRRLRRQRASLLAGGALIGLGVHGVFAATVMGIDRMADCETDACRLRTSRGRMIAADASMLGLAIGAGLLSYGLTYRIHGRRYPRVAWTPWTGRGLVGLSLSGQF